MYKTPRNKHQEKLLIHTWQRDKEAEKDRIKIYLENDEESEVI